MTRQELRVFLQDWFCGCGQPAQALSSLRELLALHPLYDHRAEFERLIPDEGLQYLMLYTLDHFDLSEHGGSVGGAWLTDKGRAVLEALEREMPDDFEALSGSCCCHGYSIDDDEILNCPECGALNRRAADEAPHD